MSKDLATYFQETKQKIQRLLKQQEAQQKEYERLKQLLENSRLAEAALRQQLELLQQKHELLQAVSFSQNDPSKKALERRIKEYIKQIDRVIDHLNQ